VIVFIKALAILAMVALQLRTVPIFMEAAALLVALQMLHLLPFQVCGAAGAVAHIITQQRVHPLLLAMVALVGQLVLLVLHPLAEAVELQAAALALVALDRSS
jgi:hypothetical protein